MVTKEGVENSSINNAGGEGSEAEEGEIVSGDLHDAEVAKALAPPPPRHSLEHAWTFWFDNRPPNKSKPLGEAPFAFALSTHFPPSKTSGIWSDYNNIHHPNKLAVGADFHCLKNKIEPKCEDPLCSDGGKWTACFYRGKSDTSWLYTFLAMIGEQFDYGDEICGAVVNVRTKQEKIALWTKNAANEAAQLSIGRQWKEFLGFKHAIGFIFHEEAKRLDRGAKNRFIV